MFAGIGGQVKPGVPDCRKILIEIAAAGKRELDKRVFR